MLHRREVLFLDINTFFSPKAGGIRTYHRAKIEWFRKRPGIAYGLVYPGAVRQKLKEAANITLIEAYGPALTKDPSGYRLLIDFFRVFRVIREMRPDVLEAGDPWLTGLFCLGLRKLGLFRGLLVSFYHSDPVPTYIEPWSGRGALRWLRAPLAKAAAFAFYRLQRGYDLTAVASRTMEQRLRAKGVRAVAHLPFGVPAHFLEAAPGTAGALAALEAQPGSRSAPEAKATLEVGSGRGPESTPDAQLVLGPKGEALGKADPGVGPVGLLYAGRLDRDKGVELLLECLPDLLKRNVNVTVMGRGAMAGEFAAFRHARYRCLGYVADPLEVRAVYDAHHVLLAPGPHETFGLGVLEGMARGLVVVGPDAGGTGEMLREAGSPFSFAAGDPESFRAAVANAIACDWKSEFARSRALALRYGTWDEAIGRITQRYAARLGVRLPGEGKP